jgi:hypothetical protein
MRTTVASRKIAAEQDGEHHHRHAGRNRRVRVDAEHCPIQPPAALFSVSS